MPHNTPYYEENKRFQIDARGEFVACVVNPKTKKPYYVYLDEDEVDLVVPSRTQRIGVGTGYYDTDPKSETSLCARLTKVPRIHCPYGVAESSTGLGTTLYVAMAIAAPLTKGTDVVAAGGNGISSDSATSQPKANAVWERLVQTGLASKKKTVLEDEEREIYVLPVSSAEKFVLFDQETQTDDIQFLMGLDLSEVDTSAQKTFLSVFNALEPTEEQKTTFIAKFRSI